MGDEAFVAPLGNEIHDVLSELFARVAYNLQVIYEALVEIGYQFKTEFSYHFEMPLHPPLPETDELLAKLDHLVQPFGYVPISLKYFYAIVGGVNFAWDCDAVPVPKWPLADPIQLGSLDDTVRYMSGEDWAEDMESYFEDEELQCGFIELSADALHKDNISGDPAYSLEIIRHWGIDGRLLNEPHDTNLVGYLRICMAHCGFPGIKEPWRFEGFQAFADQVRPRLLPF
jgi:hypothetical protein